MISFTLNGRTVELAAAPDTPLLWVLRDELGLTGTKYGCGIAVCGACTVHIDGKPQRSCSTPLASVAGKAVATIESMQGSEIGRAVQTAWLRNEVPQCGYCQSGQIMSAVALLAKNPHPSDADIDAAMRRNLCRCGTYGQIRVAIKDAAAALRG